MPDEGKAPLLFLFLILTLLSHAAPGAAIEVRTPEAAAAPMRTVTWIADDGTRRVGWAEAAMVDRFVERQSRWRAHACARLTDRVETTIDERLEGLKATVAERIPGFADWVFDWDSSSYRNIQTLKLLASDALEKLRRLEIPADVDTVEHALSEQISNHFESALFDPDDWTPRIAAVQTDLEAFVTAELGTIAANEHARRLAFVNLHVTAAPHRADGSTETGLPLALATPMGPMTPFRFDAPLPAIQSALTPERGLVTSLLARSSRPVVARLLGITFRVAAGISTFRIARQFAETTDLGLIGYVPGLAIGIGIAIATTLTFDYTIASADEFLNRRQYEKRVAVLLSKIFEDLEALWAKTARHAVMPACLGGKEQPDTP